MEEECLMCHTTPDKAPRGLVDLYGPERSFHRKKGDVISAISIRIPLATAYSEANKFSFELSLIIVFVLSAMRQHSMLKEKSIWKC